MDRHKKSTSHEAVRPESAPREKPEYTDEAGPDVAGTPNPPRTTKGGITAPKFGSAGSGGAELDPGPERD
jgi:hypothetical protein